MWVHICVYVNTSDILSLIHREQWRGGNVLISEMGRRFLLDWCSCDKSPSIAALLKLADEMAFYTERHNIGKLNLLINIALFIILFFLTRYFAGKYTSCVYFCLLML